MTSDFKKSQEFSEQMVTLYRQGNREEYEKLLKQATEIVPKTAEEYLKRGTACSFTGQREKAMADFVRAIELEPDNAEAHMRRGGMLLILKRPEEALAECEEAIRLAPDFQDAYQIKGNVFMALDRYEEAAIYYGKLAERFSDNKDFWELNRGAALSLLERYQEALSVFDTIGIPPSIEPFPSYSYYLNRAGALARLERFDEALGSLAEGMEETKKEEGCIPCFVGNCWRVPYFDSLRKPPYRQRLEAIIGSKPKVPKGKRPK
jgi:tetratricopeptide (TPR) repeat protein